MFKVARSLNTDINRARVKTNHESIHSEEGLPTRAPINTKRCPNDNHLLVLALSRLGYILSDSGIMNCV